MQTIPGRACRTQTVRPLASRRRVARNGAGLPPANLIPAWHTLPFAGAQTLSFPGKENTDAEICTPLLRCPWSSPSSTLARNKCPSTGPTLGRMALALSARAIESRSGAGRQQLSSALPEKVQRLPPLPKSRPPDPLGAHVKTVFESSSRGGRCVSTGGGLSARPALGAEFAARWRPRRHRARDKKRRHPKRAGRPDRGWRGCLRGVCLCGSRGARASWAATRNRDVGWGLFPFSTRFFIEVDRRWISALQRATRWRGDGPTRWRWRLLNETVDWSGQLRHGRRVTALIPG